jgi:hypothetical protein
MDPHRENTDCTDHVRAASLLASALLELSRQERGCDHDLCLLLDGILRDCGLQISRAVDEFAYGNEPHEAYPRDARGPEAARTERPAESAGTQLHKPGRRQG